MKTDDCTIPRDGDHTTSGELQILIDSIRYTVTGSLKVFFLHPGTYVPLLVFIEP